MSTGRCRVGSWRSAPFPPCNVQVARLVKVSIGTVCGSGSVLKPALRRRRRPTQRSPARAVCWTGISGCLMVHGRMRAARRAGQGENRVATGGKVPVTEMTVRLSAPADGQGFKLPSRTTPPGQVQAADVGRLRKRPLGGLAGCATEVCAKGRLFAGVASAKPRQRSACSGVGGAYTAPREIGCL